MSDSPRMIFVNLPVADLDRSKAFYEALGFTNEPRFTDDTAAAERAAISAMIIAILLAGLISLWLIRSITRPVFDLETGMHAVASGDFTRKLTVRPNRQDEFGRLSESYEAMANRLAQLDRLKAEFVSVASHELKTPINVILGYVELLEDGIYGKLQDQQREVCETIAAQARRVAGCAASTAVITRWRRSPISASVNVRSGACRRRRYASERVPSPTPSPR